MKTLKTHATDVGMAALAFIAGDDDLRQAFLHWSGLTGETIAARAREPEFQGFVLDFILQSDETVIDLARALGFPPEMIATARAALPGGDVPHWT